MQTGRPFHKFKMPKMKKVGRDQGMKLTMLWCFHIAILLISRNVAFRGPPQEVLITLVSGNVVAPDFARNGPTADYQNS
jgi:hypothetical protein